MGGISRISLHLGLQFHRTLMSEFLYLLMYELARLYIEHHHSAVYKTFLEMSKFTKSVYHAVHLQQTWLHPFLKASSMACMAACAYSTTSSQCRNVFSLSPDVSEFRFLM